MTEYPTVVSSRHLVNDERLLIDAEDCNDKNSLAKSITANLAQLGFLDFLRSQMDKIKRLS